MAEPRVITGIAKIARRLAKRAFLTMINLAVPRAGYRIVSGLAYGPHPRHRLDLYIPARPAQAVPVLLFFYGGGWQGGDRRLYRAIGQAFASQGILVAVADYRVYPEARYPAFLEDSAAAFVFVQSQAAAHGGDPGRLFVAGHSAGAYNAVMLAADPRYLRRSGGDPSRIRGVIGIAGPYDFLPLTSETLIAIFGGADQVQTQPVHHIDAGRPPMLLATGSEDRVVAPANSLNLAEKLRAFGSPVTVETYPGIGHVGIILSLMPGLRARTGLYRDMLRFIAAH